MDIFKHLGYDPVFFRGYGRTLERWGIWHEPELHYRVSRGNEVRSNRGMHD